MTYIYLNTLKIIKGLFTVIYILFLSTLSFFILFNERQLLIFPYFNFYAILALTWKNKTSNSSYQMRINKVIKKF